MMWILAALLRLIAVLACPAGPGPVPLCPMVTDRYHGRHRATVLIGATR